MPEKWAFERFGIDKKKKRLILKRFSKFTSAGWLNGLAEDAQEG